MQIYLVKKAGVLIPFTEEDEEKLLKIKKDVAVKVVYTMPRNYKFLKKYFVLLDHAYKNWEPANGNKMNKKKFRKDIIKAAGFYEEYQDIFGVWQIEAESISFASMTEERFEELFSNSINVIIGTILTNYTDPQIRAVVDEIIMRF